MSSKLQKTTKELIDQADKMLADVAAKEKAKAEEEFTTDISAIEELLINAKKTQSSSEGYALRAIGWSLHSIAIDLHKLVKLKSDKQSRREN